ncbi:MAG: hypothetical protein JW760_05885 [Spirochaetales bacterium]|nr:hypothetical protein [Spirochaetales bacterium]
MRYSKLMKERIRRVRVLFKELGYDIFDGETEEGSYHAGFEGENGYEGSFYIDQDSKFLELAYTFSFSSRMTLFVRDKLDEMLKICYEFGCYLNVQKSDEIMFTVFSKIYFAGLNYYSLKETLKDFTGCIDSLRDLIEIVKEGGNIHEGS